MPARTEEIVEAEEEGVAFRFLAAPLAIREAAGGTRSVLVQGMRLNPAPDNGRPVPVPVPGACWELPAQLMIVAVGQTPDLPRALHGVRCAAPSGTLCVDPDTLATSLPGVFACGDAAGGRANVTDAVAMGRRAARAIHAFVAGGAADRLCRDTASIRGFPDAGAAC